MSALRFLVFLGACFEVFQSMGLSLIVALPAFSQYGVRIQVPQCFTGCRQIQWQGLTIPLHIQNFLATLKVKEQQAPKCDFRIE